MTTLAWIIVSGILMSLIALVGSVTLILDDKTKPKKPVSKLPSDEPDK